MAQFIKLQFKKQKSTDLLLESTFGNDSAIHFGFLTIQKNLNGLLRRIFLPSVEKSSSQ